MSSSAKRTVGMGPDADLAVMWVATIPFPLISRGKVPSHLGSSLSFVGVGASIAAGGDAAGTLRPCP
jgi:hypothetical protein